MYSVWFFGLATERLGIFKSGRRRLKFDETIFEEIDPRFYRISIPNIIKN